MNKLEKFITWSLGWKYTQKDEVTIEIIHLLSSQKKVEGLEKTYTYKYLKYPLRITRPKSGKTKVYQVCPYCKKSVLMTVASRGSLKKVINITGLILGAASLALIMSLIFFGSEFTFVAFLSLMLIILTIGLLVFFLPMEYKEKGISLGSGESPPHGIDYSIDPDSPI